MGNLLVGEGRSGFCKTVRGIDHDIDLWLKGLSVGKGCTKELVYKLRDLVPPLALKMS